MKTTDLGASAVAEQVAIEIIPGAVLPRDWVDGANRVETEAQEIRELPSGGPSKVYGVRSTVGVTDIMGRRYKGVRVAWYVVDRKQPLIPIPDSRKDDYLGGAHYINECFTIEEAKALEEYIKRVHDEECEITEVGFPVPENTVPISAAPTGRSEGYFNLDKDDGYDLPFLVHGRYDKLSGDDVTEEYVTRKIVEHVAGALDGIVVGSVERDRIAAGLRDNGFDVEPCQTKTEIEQRNAESKQHKREYQERQRAQIEEATRIASLVEASYNQGVPGDLSLTINRVRFGVKDGHLVSQGSAEGDIPF